MGRSIVPVSDKYLMSVEEAAGYFGIGEGKIRTMVRNNPGGPPDWVLMNGTKTMIKRVRFEKFLDSVSGI